MRQRALLIEPNFSGHRWRYVEWTIEALLEAGYECALSTDVENIDHPLIRSYQQPDSGVSLSWLGADAERPSFARALLGRAKDEFAFHALFASAFNTATRSQAADLVVVPYGDYILKAVGLIGSPFRETPWICITMRQFFHLREMGVSAPRRPLVDFINKRLFLRALRAGNIARVLSIDPTLPLWHARSERAAHPPCIDYLPDPFPEVHPVDQAEAKARLGMASGPSILVYGSITERKGLVELLNACLTLDKHPVIVIAGQQNDSMREYLASYARALTGRIVVFDRFIPPEMEADLFSACEAVWVGYKDHYGMSGVLVQAYRFGKVAIATSAGLIGWFARNDKLGPLLEDLSAQSIRDAIDKAMNHRESDARPDAMSHCGDLLAQNTIHNFKRVIKSAACGELTAADTHHYGSAVVRAKDARGASSQLT